MDKSTSVQRHSSLIKIQKLANKQKKQLWEKQQVF